MDKLNGDSLMRAIYSTWQQLMNKLISDYQISDEVIRECKPPLVKWLGILESQPSLGRRFIALYNDGGGSSFFEVSNLGIKDSDGDIVYTEFEDMAFDYSHWAYLPYGFKFFGDK